MREFLIFNFPPPKLKIETKRSIELDNYKQLNNDLNLENKRNEKRIKNLEEKLKFQIDMNQRNKEEHNVLTDSLKKLITTFDDSNRELSKMNKELNEKNKKIKIYN